MESWGLTAGKIALSGAVVEVDPGTGRATGIRRFREE